MAERDFSSSLSQSTVFIGPSLVVKVDALAGQGYVTLHYFSAGTTFLVRMGGSSALTGTDSFGVLPNTMFPVIKHVGDMWFGNMSGATIGVNLLKGLTPSF